MRSGGVDVPKSGFVDYFVIPILHGRFTMEIHILIIFTIDRGLIYKYT